VGPNSFAEETQKDFINFSVIKGVYGWETQLGNTLHTESFLFSSKIAKLDSNIVDFHFQSEADLGLFSDISAGFDSLLIPKINLFMIL
jgi:hypothetical protein